MLRPVALLAAAAAFAVPTSADAVEHCETVASGRIHMLTVCVRAEYNLDHTTVNPSVGVDCWYGIASAPLCAVIGTDDVTVGRTGIEQGSGDIWVAGAPVIIG